MRGQDRFLIGIVAGIVVLTVVGLVIAFTRQGPTYRPDDSPEAVVYNFLLAVRQEDHDRAHRYLSPDLAGYPAVNEMARDIDNDYWDMRVTRSAINIETSPADVTEDTASVAGRVVIFPDSGPFWWQERSYNTAFRYDLKRVDGEWKLTGGFGYWVECWTNRVGCFSR